MNTVPQIAVDGLTHLFDAGKSSLKALENVSLSVEQGAFVSVIGPSGGGKTTLLRIIGGLLKPTAGIVEIGGMPPSEAQRRKMIGFVFQDPAILPWLKVIENVRLPLQLNSSRTNGNADDPQRLVEAIGLTEFADYYPHQLSGGMKQRVALARALVLNPDVLLMDEPLGSLDEITRLAMRYELLRLWELSRKTVLFVTHSIQEAVLLSDRVVIMSSRPGRILHQVEVALPRPREEDLEQSDLFLQYTRQIKEILAYGASRGTSAIGATARR